MHKTKNLFHGDIKPDNLFVKLNASIVTSDSGSLVPLNKRKKELYYPRVFTQGYASPEHMKRIRKGLPSTMEQLLQEDFHQLKQTIRMVTRKKQENEIIKGIIECLEQSKSIVELKGILIKSKFIMNLIGYLREKNMPYYSSGIWKMIPEVLYPFRVSDRDFRNFNLTNVDFDLNIIWL